MGSDCAVMWVSVGIGGVGWGHAAARHSDRGRVCRVEGAALLVLNCVALVLLQLPLVKFPGPGP